MREDYSEFFEKAQVRPAQGRDAQEHFEKSAVLSQEELARWWPFTRLDPKRFPKPEYQQSPF